MLLLKTPEEFTALDLGMQIIQRHRLQAQLSEAQSKVIDLEARVKELEEMPAKASPVGWAQTAQVKVT